MLAVRAKDLEGSPRLDLGLSYVVEAKGSRLSQRAAGGPGRVVLKRGLN